MVGACGSYGGEKECIQVHKYTLLRLTQHFLNFALTLHVSIVIDHHIICELSQRSQCVYTSMYHCINVTILLK